MAFINQGWHVGTSTRLDPGTFGGTESFYSTFKIHTFLTSGVFEYIGSQDIQVDILKIAGGGGGGGNGGGGAGGMVVESNFTISPGEYNFIVGAGGTADGTSPSTIGAGNNSLTTFTGETVAVGGGHCFTTPTGLSQAGGGSGAGAHGCWSPAGSGIAGQGNNGGGGACCGSASGGGGGGGAGAAGNGAPGFGGCPGCGGCNGGGSGAGGAGLQNDFRTGSNVWYAGGGGGGGGNVSGNGGESAGGIGGGGNPAMPHTNHTGAAGAVNTGGGGHGQGSGSANGHGGSGIIVIRAPLIG